MNHIVLHEPKISHNTNVKRKYRNLLIREVDNWDNS